MSAFIVGHDHIDGLLTFATGKKYGSPVSYYLPGGRVDITEQNATEIGRILLTENERSVKYRYPGETTDTLPGTIGEDAVSYKFKPFYGLPAVAILKACSCYDYQACETDDYQESVACKIIDAIRGRAITSLPGYDDANGWELRRPAERGNGPRVVLKETK